MDLGAGVTWKPHAGLPDYLVASSEYARGLRQSDTWLSYRTSTDPQERSLLLAHDQVLTVASGRGGASYEYDDADIVKWNDKFYVLSTSGCSCPSPDETWGIEAVLDSVEEVYAFIDSCVPDKNDRWGGYDSPWPGVKATFESVYPRV